MSGAARSVATHALAALAAGLLFGLGLSLSGMLDPARVRGFLDVGGAWDPSLVFVLGGAVSVSALGYALSRRFRRPVLAETFDLPTARRIDPPLVLGAALFGVGWGLSGFCPGPAIAGLSTGAAPVLVFVVAMLIGMAAHDLAWAPARHRTSLR
ncbi:YeeE/YedE family protein [Methylobacterium sp. E-065]|uniref:YeeE/YedE family protein n=1 Tax=unclassified Methylobacterium TaxID=2615210 RepID=UPI001FBAB3FD|nr:YeeE/YedE family protein [Methylobacterium sp. E-065]MCJ2019170.1 YeeE/YedE family protein [Methylobacterium sp. E-065]